MTTLKLSLAAQNALEACYAADQAAEAAHVVHVPTLQIEFAGWARDDVRAACMKIYATLGGVELKIGERGTRAGQYCWPATAGTLKKACDRLIAKIVGASAPLKADPTEGIDAEQSQECGDHAAALAITALAATDGDKTKARKLAAAALAEAFAAL